MAWVKLDDGFFLHPKAIAAGRDARALFLALTCWANRSDTDGRCGGAAIQAAAQMAELDVADASLAVDALVRVGLLEPTPGGWLITDWETIRGAERPLPLSLMFGSPRGKPCTYCGKREATSWDHIVPRSRGGEDTRSNLVPACQSCNSSKGALTPHEWWFKRHTEPMPAHWPQATEVA